MKLYTAEEVCDLVSDIIASGDHPVSRARLLGLTLNQVQDAVKIQMTQLYLDDDFPASQFEELHRNWNALLASLPASFTRDDVWQAAKELAPEIRRAVILGKGAGWIVDKEKMNAEEFEFANSETLDSFLTYMKLAAKHSNDPFTHVLGHLSKRAIYYDDSIPVMPDLKSYFGELLETEKTMHE